MNAAKRLAQIERSLSKMRPAQPQTQALIVWSMALGLDTPAPPNEDEIVAALSCLRSEAAGIIAALKAKGIPDHLFVSQISGFRSAASSTSLHQQWQSVSGAASNGELRLALGWAGEVLPEEDGQVDSKQLSELSNEFDSLTAAIADANLPAPLRRYAEQQIRTLRSALRLYPVRGVAGLEEALSNVAGAHALAKARAEASAPPDEEAQSTMQAVNGAVRRFAHVVEVAEKANKGVAAIKGITDSLAQVWDWGRHLLPPP